MRTYGQFCPVARTSELLAERWTPIIIRNLLNGCRTFTEIRQGAPGIPTALLTKRLDTLERYGIVERERIPSARGWSYRLTEQGQDLKAVCDAMGQWGARWLEIEPHHTDPAYVLWATTKLVDVEKLPDRTVVVRFELRDRPGDSYWLLLRKPTPELCTKGTGYVEDIIARIVFRQVDPDHRAIPRQQPAQPLPPRVPPPVPPRRAATLAHRTSSLLRLGHQARTIAPGGRSRITDISAGQPPLARRPITTMP